ncbi:Integrase, catalytic core [Gossypium australe]|uniref:Integrase, catalytic core n=1 Tax=Gossypium australe TaxID=47621 RepID=A0A5B6VK63_9ROSI|nr:Integrase, catalytic core [Gossypium australe]
MITYFTPKPNMNMMSTLGRSYKSFEKFFYAKLRGYVSESYGIYSGYLSTSNEDRSLARYYCRFFEEFSFLVSPLTKLLRKDVHFKWIEEQQSSFKKLKSESRKYYVVYSDASYTNLGGKLVAYKWKQHECNYPTHDLELTVVVFALKI